MARISFGANISLDGFVNDSDGNFDWAEPSEEIHLLWNDLDRAVGTRVYGRGLYETMVWWETMPPDDSPIMNDYATLWRDSDKIVVSSTLTDVSSARTTLERSLDFLPALKQSSTHDISIGGPTLAAQALDLIDDLHLVVHPVTLGAGTSVFGTTPATFELAQSRVFGTGAVYLHYRRG